MSTITSSYEGASYHTSVREAVQARSRAAGASARIELTETTPDGDTVEISPPGASPGNPPRSGSTYRPPRFSDRFHYDIQNGMFNKRLRFNAVTPRFNTYTAATYSARQGINGQVAGQGGIYSAMFDLFYQDSQPDPTDAGSHVDARAELNRMADQNLNLLHIL